MASLFQYVDQMRDRQMVISRKLGSDIGRTQKQDRVMNLALLILIAVVVKVLVDKGVITDAELLGELNRARDAAYDDEPGNLASRFQE